MLPQDGTLPTTQGMIYRVPTGGRASITGIEVVNRSGASATFTLFAKINGVARPITPINVRVDNGYQVQDTFQRILGGGMTIEAVANAELDFILWGTESS